MTDAERRLWGVLHNFRPRFTAQLSVSHFIIDIACRSAKVAIELDGGHHAEQATEDAERTAYLQSRGRVVLRFWNNDVMTNVDGVAGVVLATVASRASTHPRPLPSREGRRRWSR
jgi:very-short-patch-repair endonuclease